MREISLYVKDQKKSWAEGLRNEGCNRYPFIAGAEKLWVMVLGKCFVISEAAVVSLTVGSTDDYENVVFHIGGFLK